MKYYNLILFSNILISVAREVLSYKLHKIGKMTLEVELWDVSTVEEEKETKNINSIVVKWKGQHLKEEEIDFVEMYFENKRKSGGGIVEHFHYDENKKAIYITFKEDGGGYSFAICYTNFREGRKEMFYLMTHSTHFS